MNNTKLNFINVAFLVIAFTFNSCEIKELPIYGRKVEIINGNDTLIKQYTIPSFDFENQDGKRVTDKSLKGKIYCTDFFFTTCRSICPTVNANIAKVQQEFKGNTQIRFLSHTLNPQSDTKAILKDYANKLGADLDTWDFVTGKESTIYEFAEKHYFITAKKDEAVLDGIDHSGRVILVDTKGRIRGYYDFTDDENIELLIQDIKLLESEK